jgi:Asp/Glu/hydantoin racemase
MALIRLLVVNPNTTTSMTDTLRPMVARVLTGSSDVACDFFTAPAPPSDAAHPGALPSINSPADAELSAEYLLPRLADLAPTYDGILIACYSEHPLVRLLGDVVASLHDGRRRYVMGIFEASVIASLALLAQLPSASTFGIVSTGAVWGTAFAGAVRVFAGGSARFAACETTGLSALELHALPAADVRTAMVRATTRLLKLGQATGAPVRVVCMGCAGMAGLEEAVREGAQCVLGENEGKDVRIVDGVVAGVGWLVAACRARF